MCAMSPRLLRPRATGFNPRAIANLSLWLDAADTGSTTLVSGAVSQWNDKSGNGRNATQTVANNRPTTGTVNGRQAIVFNGTSNSMACSAPLAANVTFFYVTSPSTQNDTYLFGSTGSGGSPTILSRYTNVSSRRDYEWWAGNGSDRLIIATSASGQNVLTITHRDGGLVECWLNGTFVTSKATATAVLSGLSLATLGAATSSVGFSNATMCEMLIYQRAVSATERAAVHSYLGKKWGLTVA